MIIYDYINESPSPHMNGKWGCSSQDLHDVRQLAASSGAFAAICGPLGRVVAWGSKSYGGDAGRVQEIGVFFNKNCC